MALLRDWGGRGVWRVIRLSQSRMMAWSTVLLVQELLVLAFMIAGTHGMIVPLDKPITTDYASFYAAGNLADTGPAALAYDRSAHHAAEQRATEPGVAYVFFFYPPMFLLLCALLARIPYLASLLIFDGVTIALYLLTMRQVLQARGLRWIIPIAAFPACFLTVGLGQNAFLTAALFAGATVMLERRQVLAGILFGALCYKPHFGLLLPVVFIAGGYWRAALAAAFSVSTMIATSVAVFGWATWQAYLAAFISSPAVYAAGQVKFSGFITPFGAARLLHLSPDSAYAVQGAVTLTVVALVAWLWRRDRRPSVRYAALIAGTMLAVPLALFYDLVVETVAIAWLVRGQSASSLPTWEKLSLVVIYAVALCTAELSTYLSFPLGPVPALLLLGICVTRSLQYRPLPLSWGARLRA